jgi:hypothetical protein
LKSFRHRLHAIDGLDQVRARPLGHLDSDRRLAVQPRDGIRILEGRADRREIACAHHRVAAGRDRQVGDVLDGLDQQRHLDGIFAFLAFQRAGGNKLVVARTPAISWSSCRL